MVLKKSKFGLNSGATVRSRHNFAISRRKVQSNVIFKVISPPISNSDVVNLKAEKQQYLDKLSRKFNDGLPCNANIYEEHLNVAFSINKKKGWLLEKKVSDMINTIKEESQLYNEEDIPHSSCTSQPRIRLQVLHSCQPSVRFTENSCVAYYDSSLNEPHPVSNHKYSYATDLLYKENPAYNSLHGRSCLKIQRKKQRSNQYKTKSIRGIQRKSSISQKICSSKFTENVTE